MCTNYGKSRSHGNSKTCCMHPNFGLIQKSEKITLMEPMRITVPINIVR